MKNKTAGRGYVRKTCYFCYHCYRKENKGLSYTERSDLVTEVTDIFTIPHKVSIDRQIACENRSKTCPSGRTLLLTSFVITEKITIHRRRCNGTE